MLYGLSHGLVRLSQATLTVRAAALTGFGTLCRSLGLDDRHLLRRVGLWPNAEAEPDRRVSAPAVNRAFELAATESGRPDFAMLLSELRGFSNLGPVSLLARDEPSVGDALSAIEAYLPLHNDALTVTRERFGDVVVTRLALLGSAEPLVQSIDIAVAMHYRILARLAGETFPAEEVCLTRARPANVSAFTRVLGPNVRFEAPFDGIVVRAALLDRPNPMAEAALRPYAAQVVGQVQAGRNARMTDRVRRLLALLLSSGRCTATRVAEVLGTSRRTLTRQLAAEGTTFLALLDEARDAVAQRHLAAGARGLAEIADLLGFSGHAAFTTWFRKRHGVPPGAWRPG